MRRRIRLLVLCIGFSVIAAGPALAQDISGTWSFTVQLDVGSGEPTFIFEQDGDTLSGSYQGTFGESDVNGTVDGDQVEFWFETQGTKATYTGTISGNTMSGTCDYGEIGAGEWEASKAE